MSGAPGGDDALARLATEHAAPDAPALDLLAPEALARHVFRADRACSVACERAAPAVGRVIEGVAEALAAGGRLVYVGAGTSGRLALLDAVELGPTFDLPADRTVVLLAGGDGALLRAQEGAEDRPEGGARAVHDAGVGPLDFVLGVAASGRTPFTLGALAAAARRGARTALVACNPPPAPDAAEIVVVLDTGPEVLAGSTRMKAGTATKMTLNAISLGAMARLGKVHGAAMVDVRVTSEKLRARALRLVADLGGVDAARAAELLAATGGRVKPAVVMARCGVDAAAAAARLAAAGDVLRAALAGDVPERT